MKYLIQDIRKSISHFRKTRWLRKNPWVPVPYTSLKESFDNVLSHKVKAEILKLVQEEIKRTMKLTDEQKYSIAKIGITFDVTDEVYRVMCDD